MVIELSADCVLVFDLDDTLCRERDFLTSGFREVARALGAADPAAFTDWMVDRYDAGKEVFVAAIERARQKAIGCDITLSTVLEIYREHRPAITLREDAARLLERCAVAGLPLALITDGRSSTQRNKLSALGILDRLNPICISEEVGQDKPDHASFLHVMDTYPDCPCVYVGDNPSKDFIAPNALGWNSICLRDDGHNIHPQDLSAVERQARPQYVVDSLDSIQFFRS